jgi:hypothetical protein
MQAQSQFRRFFSQSIPSAWPTPTSPPPRLAASQHLNGVLLLQMFQGWPLPVQIICLSPKAVKDELISTIARRESLSMKVFCHEKDQGLRIVTQTTTTMIALSCNWIMANWHVSSAPLPQERNGQLSRDYCTSNAIAQSNPRFGILR